MRLSELDGGRSGNPPASPEAIQNLAEIEIGEENKVKDPLSG